MIQQTFALIKPDAVRRGLTQEILRRISGFGLRVIKLEETQATREEAEAQYEIHRGRPFFGDLVEFTTSGPMVKMVLEGKEAINRWRQLMGATSLADAAPGTIRGDLGHFGASPWETLVHGSDSVETAKREIDLYFPEA